MTTLDTFTYTAYFIKNTEIVGQSLLHDYALEIVTLFSPITNAEGLVHTLWAGAMIEASAPREFLNQVGFSHAKQGQLKALVLITGLFLDLQQTAFNLVPIGEFDYNEDKARQFVDSYTLSKGMLN